MFFIVSIYRFSRHFLGTIVICMVRLSSLSLIQNRADDFCTSYARLRRKRLWEKPSFMNPFPMSFPRSLFRSVNDYLVD